jgi:hypothetical protein
MDYESQIKILTGLVAITVLCEEAELSDYDKERGLKRGADGKWTSNKSEGSSDDKSVGSSANKTEDSSSGDIDNEKDIITPEKALAPLNIDKAVKDVNKLDDKTKQGFMDCCLKNNQAFKALASALTGAVKDGFKEGEKLLKKVADSMDNSDVEKAWRDFSKESNRVIKESAKQSLQIAKDIALGVGIVALASWGVMSALASGGAALALPGIIVGAATGTTTLGNVAFQVLKMAGYGMWAGLSLNVMLPKLSKQIGQPIGGETLKAVGKIKIPDTDSDEILALYDVSKNKVEQYKQGLEDKKKTEGESSGASIKLEALKNRLDLLEQSYKSFLEKSSSGESGAVHKDRLDNEIENLKKEIETSMR